MKTPEICNSSMEKPRFFRPKPPPEQASIPESADPMDNADSLFVQDDDDDEDVIEVIQEPQTSGRSQRSPDISFSQPQSSTLSQPPGEQTTLASLQDSNGSDTRLSQIGFDLFQSQLISIIGDVSAKALHYLYKKYFNRPNYIQLATNEYFNGLEMASLDHEEIKEVKDEAEERTEEIKQLQERMRTQAKQDQEEINANLWKRYIGTLHLEAWATRPYLRPLKYKQPLVVKRLIPSKIKKSAKVQAKFGDSAVIRLYTDGSDNREIGRLPEDVTRILSPLIDLDLAHFEATVMMETSSRISIGDPFYLLIRCFLNNNTFVSHEKYVGSEDVDDPSPTKKRKVTKTAGFNYSQETDAEAALRLKQKSISKLFEKLQISPYDENAPQTEELVVLDEDASPGESGPQENNAVDELSLDQLKDFYTANQHSDYLNDLPETTSPPQENFKLELRSYQKHGLSWMLAREKEIDTLETLSTTDGENFSTQKRQAIRQDDGVVNPLWSKYKWPSDPQNDNDSQSEDDFFYANLYNGEMSITKPMMKSFVKGGILADEMGLGKTISTLSLIHSVPYDRLTMQFEPPRYASKTTLIIVPISLLSQWKSEFDRSNNNKNHRCFIYYGDTVQADFSQTLCGRSTNIPIVVLTTYGTVQNEWTRFNKMRDENGKLPKLGLFSVEYFRIVLDEGHTIRNRTTKTAKSVHELDLRRKWVLTGTPVVNRLDDIFSIVKFLKLDPWSNFSYWKTFVTLPFEQKKFNQTLDVVKSILQPIFLRRTKNMKLKDGKPLISLPDKEIVVEELEFGKREQLLYDFFKNRAFQSFKDGMKSGDLLKKYTQILTHILRLRQICCHPDLVSKSDELDETWAQELAEFENPSASERFENDTKMRQALFALYKRVDIPNSECSICTQAPISVGEMIVTECGHCFCLHCLKEHIEFQSKNGNNPLCPDCRGPISLYRLFKTRRKETDKKEVRFHTNEHVDEPGAKYDFQIYHYDPDRTSSKIEALISHVIALKDQAPGEQVVVFSQFSSYLDLIENELKDVSKNGDDFEVYKFDGRLNLNEREKILLSFTAERKVKGKVVVLLLSLKAGGVGLNLTCANRAFMMDPWWSPSVEDQAIDRIHRIGQAQNVKVVRFIVKGSIETKMLRIQDRKRMMGEAVEVEEEERRKQRIEEIKLLFEE